MDRRLDPITNWDTRAREARYHVETLARSVRVTRQQLCRHFRIRFGFSTRAWLEKLKKQDALSLVQEGKPIQEIAQQLGYKHSTHFTRAFRRAHGSPPRSFVARNR